MIKKFNKSILQNKLINLQKEKNHSTHWNITWLQGKVLKSLIETKKPSNILEIGTSNGFSTLFLCDGFEENENFKLTTIEVDKERFEEAKKNFQSCSLEENINQINKECLEYLEKEEIKEKFNFVFLDAAHKKYIEIVQTLEKKDLLSDKCILVADNVLSHTYMVEFIDFMKKKYEKTTILKLDSGFLISFINY